MAINCEQLRGLITKYGEGFSVWDLPGLATALLMDGDTTTREYYERTRGGKAIHLEAARQAKALGESNIPAGMTLRQLQIRDCVEE